MPSSLPVRRKKRCSKPLTPGLELVKDYGWLTILAKPLYWLLDKIHGFLRNWGWSIVGLVLLLKIAFYWLNAKAYSSMAKMKAINPRITEMRERLKDNPQQMQQEMMKIYREEKVNPMGGCFPIMIQIPVFIALYWVLLSSVEMRNAPWILWIQDLSSPDPYFILPIVMTLTTLLQTALNPAPPDPMQAKLMWFMPLIFSVMFFFFPAGLVLYWITNNVLSIAQQWIINTRMGVPPQFNLPKFSNPEQTPEAPARLPQGATPAARQSRFRGVPDITPPCCHVTAIPSWPSPRRRGVARWASCGSAARTWGRVMAHLLGRTLRPREATYLPFLRRARVRAIDQGLALYLPGAAFVHRRRRAGVAGPWWHRGAAVAAGALPGGGRGAGPGDRAAHLPGMRLAQPGEFTQRAFLNDKMDLAQAEAIADLIDASTETAARSATRSLSGEFSREIHALRDALIHLRMLVEATLDFPEEEIDFLRKVGCPRPVGSLATGFARRHAEGIARRIAARGHQGGDCRPAQCRQVLSAQCTGRCRTGHRLADCRHHPRQGAADHPDRGRAAACDRHGRSAHSDDDVEQMGIARAWEAIEGADAVLFLHDLTRTNAMDYIAGDALITGAIAQKVSQQVPVIDIWNKADAAPGAQPGTGIVLSAKTGAGLDALRRTLLETAGWQVASGGIFIARERHVQALRRVNAHLVLAAQHLAAQDQSLDLLAEELRLGQNALSEITGEFTSDDLLGVIFSKFCIGK